MSPPDLFDATPASARPTPAQAPPAPVQRPAFPFPRPTVPRPLTAGERACACGLVATCGMGPEERAAVEWASRGPLFAPGPANGDLWRQIAERAPERLPALSRHDLFRIEIGKARAAAYGLAAPGSAKAWGDAPPETWVDQSGPYGLRPAIVQEIAQSTLRRGSDGVATRIDELRMLGNGVVDLEGAYALRSLAADLAARSSGATELVRLMAGSTQSKGEGA